MKKNGLWVIAFVIVALMVLTSVSPLSTNRTETIDNTTYIISNTPPDNPELGDLWFDTTLDEMNIYNGYVWQNLVPTVSGAGYQDHAAKHYWGGVDPISFQELSPEIRVASEFATSGSGTASDPYIGGVQEAIDDLGGMGTVYIPYAYFNIMDTININNEIFLISTGYSFSRGLKLADGVEKTLLKINAGGVVIEGVSFLGNKAGNPLMTEPLIEITSGTDSIMKDCVIESGKGVGLEMSGGTWINIQGCFIEGHEDHAVYMHGAENIRFHDNFIGFSKTAEPVISLASTSKHITFNNNWLYSSNTNLVDCYISNVKFIGNTIYLREQVATVRAFYLGLGSSNIQIQQNQFQPYHDASEWYSLVTVVNTAIDHIDISGNHMNLATTISKIYVVAGANLNGTVHDNLGYITEKSSSSTITNGNTHVTVTHGMNETPTSITVTGNHSEVSACWIVNITSTQFEIWVSSAVTYDRVVYWYAEAR